MKKLFFLLLILSSCQTKEENEYWRMHYRMRAKMEYINAIGDIHAKMNINKARLRFMEIDSMEREFRKEFNQPTLPPE